MNIEIHMCLNQAILTCSGKLYVVARKTDSETVFRLNGPSHYITYQVIDSVKLRGYRF